MQLTARDAGKRSRCSARKFHVADPNGKQPEEGEEGSMHRELLACTNISRILSVK